MLTRFLRTFLVINIVSYSSMTWSGIKTFDWLRGKVNEGWYNAIIGSCEKESPWIPRKQEGFKQFLRKSGYCSPNSVFSEVKDIAELEPDLQEKVFFDQITIDLAKKNQCLCDYWHAMSTSKTDNLSAFSEQNETLMKDHPLLKGNLSVTSGNKMSSAKISDAKQAQAKVVRSMIEVANKIARKKVEMRDLPISLENVPQRKKILNEIAILESSVPLSEDTDARSFYSDEIYSKIYNKVFFGQPIDLTELETKVLDDSKNSFQEKVVTKKLKQITEAQKELAEMHGNYINQHSFKVTSFEKGYAEELLFNSRSKGGNFPYFTKLNCSLQSKYGIGSEVSTLSNSVVLGGATLAIGGAGLAMAKLTRTGFVGTRTYEVFNTTANIANGTLTSTDLAVAMLQSCFDSNAGKNEFSSCSKSELIKTKGITSVVDNELEANQCLTNVAFSALSGGVGLKQATLAKKVTLEKGILRTQLQQKRDEILEGLEVNSDTTASVKQKLKEEVDRTLAFVATDGIPNTSVLKALSKEDPEGLLQMLTEINAGAKKTWKQKIGDWLNSKGLTKEESNEVQTCIVNTSK